MSKEYPEWSLAGGWIDMQWAIGWWMRNEPNETLFHYTSPSGLLGIIASQTLWATGIRYLNDASEMSYAAELASRVIGEQLETRADALSRRVLTELAEHPGRVRDAGVYVVSFCENGNLLCQWRAYGQGTGYALGFGTKYWDYKHNGPIRLRKVLYEPDEQRELICELLRLTYEEIERYVADYGESVLMDRYAHPLLGCLRTILSEVLPCLKHPAFREEQEWRLIVRQGHQYVGGRPPAHEVHFREGKLGVVPYIKLPLLGHEEPFAGRLPITELCHGPTEHPDEVRDALGLLLRKHGYDGAGTVVRGASVPLRL
jgi:hypothetical protein